MEITSTSTGAATTPAAAAKPAGKGLVGSDFETFLNMLTVQMQNQDPLNPLESTDFAVQLATFSGVEQQVRTNDLLKTLGDQLGLMGLSEMASWVGMEARVAAPVHFDGTPIDLAPNPPAIADRMELVVRDSAGTVVDRINLPVSADPVSWAGVDDEGAPLPEGLYAFTLESYTGDTLLETQAVEAYARVSEARVEGGATVLVLSGGAKVNASAVTGLREAA